MRNVVRVNIDTAGGTITGIISTKTTVNGHPIVCIGAAIAPHGSGAHANATMATGSARTKANGIGICGVGDLATCGDVAAGGNGKTLVT